MNDIDFHSALRSHWLCVSCQSHTSFFFHFARVDSWILHFHQSFLLVECFLTTQQMNSILKKKKEERFFLSNIK